MWHSGVQRVLERGTRQCKGPGAAACVRRQGTLEEAGEAGGAGDDDPLIRGKAGGWGDRMASLGTFAFTRSEARSSWRVFSRKVTSASFFFFFFFPKMPPSAL